MDYLQIEALTAETRIGVYQWEQQILQKLCISLRIPADFSACEDNLAKTIDYDQLCQQVTDYVESNSFQLIETVAHNIALLIKEKFAVKQLTVTVAKPQAIKNAAKVEVTVVR